MPKPRVLVTAHLLADFPGPHVEIFERAGFEVVFPEPWPTQMTEPEILQAIPGFSAVLAGSEPYTSAVFAAAPELRVIARLGVGHDAVDKAAATQHGVAVAIAVGGNQEAVAEHAFAFILGFFKQVRPTMDALLGGEWVRAVTQPLRGKTLGIVGLGRIGKAMVPRAQAFRLKVLAAEIAPDEDFIASHGIELVPLDELLRRSDIVSMHVPLTPLTRHMIRAETLALMKPSALLVNTARGGVVHEPDLLEALREGRIAGAALDVYAHEPLRGGHPLFGQKNVLLTPHTAGTDEQARHDMARLAAQAIVELKEGRWPAEQIVNAEVRERFRW